MKKDIINNIITIISFICCILVCVNLPQSMRPFFSSLSYTLVALSSPVDTANRIKEKFSPDIPATQDNNTTTTSQKTTSVMNPIVTEDSDDDSTITDVPKDIKKLMQDAKSSTVKSKSLGKTSEEPYQGGGTIVSYNDLQVQSKIPSSFYKLNIKKLLDQDCKLSISDKSKPTILVYHSHTTEAYSLLDVGYYMKSDSRSNDPSRNMVRVGDELVRYLEKAGFNVIHDTDIHDKDYNASYDSSRASMEKYLEQYPSIDVTIDVHRDDITYSNKTKVKPTAKILGKKAARMMIISGCEYGSVSNFPDWEHNLRFNLQVQNKVNELYPNLMRPIYFAERKYNMYETHYSFLLEVGTDANTLDEACYSARLFGKALGDLLNEKYVK